MPQEIVKFTISQDGTVTEDVIGFTDGECINITKDIEEKLGSLEIRQFKPEFYSNNKNVTLQHNQNENQRETLSD